MNVLDCWGCVCVLNHVEDARRLGFLMGGCSARFVLYQSKAGGSLLYQADTSGHDMLLCSYECDFLWAHTEFD